MPRFYATVTVLALLGGQAAYAGPIIVGTVPPPASSPATTAAAATPAPAPAPAPTPAVTPVPTPAPSPVAMPAAAAHVAAAPDAAAPTGAPLAPDLKKFSDANAFLAANLTFRSKVAMAWARGQIDAATFRSLMATYRSNVRAGKVAAGS